VVGGGNGPNGHNLLRSVERAKIQPDGSLGSWITDSSTMNIPRRCSKVLAIDSKLYSFGGFGGALLDTVEHAAFKPDGSLGQWQMEPQTMTMPRYVNGVKAVGDKAYVIGGHDQSRGVGVTNVEWSRVGNGGSFEKWQPASPLNVGRYGLATAGHSKYFYALGGITGVEYVDSIERSERSSNGGLGVWTMTTALETPLASFSAIVVRDWLYVLGGTNRDGYSRAVLYATFDTQGDIGFPGTKADERAHQEKRAARSAIVSDLPNAGVVREVLQTSAYSYVLVEGQNGTTWLAGPKTEISVGAHIRYSQGVYMTNFFSKELRRAFDEVTFVGTIEKAQ
jgi:hypothetical protein